MTGERLTSLDTAFLHAESPRSPMHVGAVVFLDGDPLRDEAGRVRLDDLRSYLEGRLHLAPRLRQVVRPVPFGIGRPVWVDDTDFDIAHHVRLASLPSPGDDATLLRFAEEVMMRCLDRSRPLWEWWVLDGLADGRVALVEKVHHALIDGVSGVQVMAALSDLADFAPPAEEEWAARPAPSSAGLITDALSDAAREPWRIVGDLGRLGKRAGHEAKALIGFRPNEPRLLRSATLGHRRSLTPVVLSLAEVKKVGHLHDTKVNDVVLSVVAGGLGELLRSRGHTMRGEQLHALVPESVRTDDEHLALGNRVGGMFAPLPVDEADPVARLHVIRDVMQAKRSEHEGESVSMLLDATDHLPPAAVRLMVRLVDEQPFVSTVVTNIPGPRDPMSVMGARIDSMIPVVPLAGRITLGVAVLSYQDDLTIAVHADADAHPDIEVMATGMREAFSSLRDASLPRPG